MTHHLSVPVLRHRSFKPSYSCIKAIRKYFSSLPRPIHDDQLIVVGARIFTDVVLANRMMRRREKGRAKEGPLSVWTEGVWGRESMVLRAAERKITELARRWVNRNANVGGETGETATLDYERFVRVIPPPTEVLKKIGLLNRVWNSLRGV